MSLAGYPAYLIIYRFSEPYTDYNTMTDVCCQVHKAKEIGSIIGNLLYIARYEGGLKAYTKNLVSADNIIASLQIDPTK